MACQKSPNENYNIQLTVKCPPFAYIHLTLLNANCILTPTPNQQPPLDILTARTYLTSALEQFLGMTGSAIAVDFLKVEGRDVWIRVPRQDASAVAGAVSQWISKDKGSSWRISARGEWLGGLLAGDGSDVFGT